MYKVNQADCLVKIKEIRSKIISEMKLTKDKIKAITGDKRQKTIESINDFGSQDNKYAITRAEIDNKINTNTETLSKLELEKNLLVSAINNKEKEINELDYMVFTKLPSEFSNLEFLLKKEMEIYNKMKVENNFLHSKNEILSNELKEMIKIYKEIAHIDLEKTKEGYLKIVFFKSLEKSNLPSGANLVVEIKEGTFKIISVFPNIKISHYEEELSVTQNFTLFLAKVANDFLKFLI